MCLTGPKRISYASTSTIADNALKSKLHSTAVRNDEKVAQDDSITSFENNVKQWYVKEILFKNIPL